MKKQKPDVIIIDDDPISLLTTRQVIEASGKTGIIKFFKLASDALDYIQGEGRHLSKNRGKTIIFSDFKMPKLNGLEFAYQLFETHPKEFTVFILSGTPDGLEDTAKQIPNVRGIFGKPFTTNDYEEALAKVG